MANFTPEELERYKEWAESLKGPQMSSLDDVLEAQREAQAAAEIAARGEKAAGKSLGTLGEIAKGVEGIKVTTPISPAQASAKVFEEAGSALPKNIAESIVEKQQRLGKSAADSAKIFEAATSPAAESAKIFEEAGSALPKNIAEDIVTKQSRLGKTAEQAAEILAPKELPTVSNVRPVKDLIIQGERLSEKISRGLPSIIEDAIPTTGRVIGEEVPKVSVLGKLAKYLPAVGLGVAGYETLKGDVVEGGLTGLETLLGSAAPRLAAPLELLRPTKMMGEKEARASEIGISVPREENLRRQRENSIRQDLKARGFAEESIFPQDSSQIASVTSSPIQNGSPVVPEIKSIKQQKTTPVAKSDVSSGIGEKESLEAKLSEAIKAESEQAKKPEMDFTEMLRMAQESRDKSQLLANIGKASELFATGLTGTVPMGVVTKPVAQDYYDKLIKQAEQPIEDVGAAYTMKTKQDEMQRLARRRDPGSEESKAARALLKGYNITVPETATAEVLEKYTPQLVSIKEKEIAAKEQAANRAALLSDKSTTKEEQQINKDFTKMSEKLTSELASSRSSFGKSAGIMRSAEAMETFIKNINPKDITTRQIYELARGLDAMLSQGAATITGTKKLIPDTYSGDVAKIAEYILSKPKGAGQEAFVEQMMETVSREKKLALEQVARTQKRILSGYSHLKQKDPTRYKEILETFELPSDEQLAPESKEQKIKNQVKLPKDKRNVPGKRIEYSGKVYVIDPSGETATEE